MTKSERNKINKQNERLKEVLEINEEVENLLIKQLEKIKDVEELAKSNSTFYKLTRASAMIKRTIKEWE